MNNDLLLELCTSIYYNYGNYLRKYRKGDNIVLINQEAYLRTPAADIPVTLFFVIDGDK